MLNYSNAYTRYIWFHGAIFCLVLLLMPARQIIAAERELTLSTFPGSIHQAVGAPILKEAYAKLGMSLKLYMVPAKRALAASSAGATDGEVNPMVLALAAGATHACGLREDGSPVCWGTTIIGRATPPEGRYSALAAGSYHTCGIRLDGTVACSAHELRGRWP